MNIIFGTLESYARNLALEMKWQKKVATGRYTAEEPKTEREELQQQVWEQHANTDEQLTAITRKLDMGEELSPEELDYLRQKNPTLYQKAVQAAAERRSYEQALKRCKTKEDVERLKLTHLGQSLSRVQQVSNNPAIPLSKKLAICLAENAKVKGIERVTRAFMQSGEYAALETEAERTEHLEKEQQESMPDSVPSVPEEDKTLEPPRGEEKDPSQVQEAELSPAKADGSAQREHPPAGWSAKEESTLAIRARSAYHAAAHPQKTNAMRNRAKHTTEI